MTPGLQEYSRKSPFFERAKDAVDRTAEMLAQDGFELAEAIEVPDVAQQIPPWPWFPPEETADYDNFEAIIAPTPVHVAAYQTWFLGNAFLTKVFQLPTRDGRGYVFAASEAQPCDAAESEPFKQFVHYCTTNDAEKFWRQLDSSLPLSRSERVSLQPLGGLAEILDRTQATSWHTLVTAKKYEVVTPRDAPTLPMFLEKQPELAESMYGPQVEGLRTSRQLSEWRVNDWEAHLTLSGDWRPLDVVKQEHPIHLIRTAQLSTIVFHRTRRIILVDAAAGAWPLESPSLGARIDNAYVVKEQTSGLYVTWGDFDNAPAAPPLGPLANAMTAPTVHDAQSVLRAIVEDGREGTYIVDGPLAVDRANSLFDYRILADIWSDVGSEKRHLKRLEKIQKRLAKNGTTYSKDEMLYYLWLVAMEQIRRPRGDISVLESLITPGHEDEIVDSLFDVALSAAEDAGE